MSCSSAGISGGNGRPLVKFEQEIRLKNAAWLCSNYRPNPIARKDENTMHASITLVTIRPDQAAEATRLWQEEIMPVTRTQAGWQGAELFTNDQTGEGVAINLYTTAADANAVEASGMFQQLMGKLAALMTAPPVRKIYTVSGQARA
jgi:hypothetical protein